MKVLFAGPTSPDHLMCCLWDGFQDLLGKENVFASMPNAALEQRGCKQEGELSDRNMSVEPIVASISGSRPGKRLGAELACDELTDFDLLLVFSSFNRDHGWQRIRDLTARLRPKGKIVFIEGWDAAWQIEKPEISFDAYFRKELLPGGHYPYAPIYHLSFAAPARWFQPLPDVHRPYDVVFIGNPCSNHPERDVRWAMLQNVWKTRKRHASVVATAGLGHDTYWRILRQSKLALCPAAADGADSLRTYEALAAGCIPIFVGYPNHIRDPWFPPELIYDCQSDTLAEHIDEALSHDLRPKRQPLLEWGKKHHATRTRAEKVLRVLGLEVPS
jgi:hypothetical protein